MAAARRATLDRPDSHSGMTTVEVLASDTWRRSWRESVVRVTFLLLILLTIVAGVAALGSPTAGDAAVQMLALAFMVVPFGVVLVAGQVWGSPAAEVTFLTRPVTAEAYVLGRTLGLVAVGAAMLLVVDVVGSLTLFAIVRLPLVSVLEWDTAWCLGVVLPSLILTGAACAWLVTRTGGGARYFTTGMVLALVVGFVEYKWTALALVVDPRWVLWNPFPGLLTLGLALPPELLGVTAGWLTANRVLWLLVAGAVLTAAMRLRSRSWSTPSLRFAHDSRTWQALAAAGILAAAWLEMTAVSLSPPVLSASAVARAAAANHLVVDGPLSLQVTVNRGSGRLAGVATSHVRVFGTGAVPVWFWLNRGLAVDQVTWNGGRVTLVHDGGRVESGTAARLVAFNLSSGDGVLTISYSGRVLPLATWLPTPPFAVGTTPEGIYAGDGRLYWDGTGSWYPQLLAPKGDGAPLFQPTTLSVRVTGRGQASQPLRTRLAARPGVLPAVVWLEGPYRVTTVDGVRVYARRPWTSTQRAVLSDYAAALHGLEAWLPGSTSQLPAMVANPLGTSPEMTPSLVALPANQPYCQPDNPLLGGCAPARAPSALSAWLLMARLAWSGELGLSTGTLSAFQPVFPAHDQRGALLAVLAAATVVRADAGGPLARSVAALGYQHPAPLPGLGRLTRQQAAWLKQLSGWAASASPAAWSRWAARVVQTAGTGALTWTAVTDAEGS